MATDERREGELDLADMIGSYLWDVCEGEDEAHLAAISEAAMGQWEELVRELLNRHRVNLFWYQDGMRKQTEVEASDVNYGIVMCRKCGKGHDGALGMLCEDCWSLFLGGA